MEALECIRSRMSIRAFKKEPVPEEVLKEIVETACWSPSYKNTQPWEVMILSGKKKEELSEMLVSLLERGEPPCPDLPEPEGWPERNQKRIERLYRMRAERTGIDLSDPEVIRKAKIANFRFYGAPHVIYLFQDGSLPLWSLFDLGLFAQSLMLAAHAKGVGTVPQAFTTDYARYIKDFLGIDSSKRLVLGISTGYPDWESPANSFRPDRAGLEEILSFVS
ncbi:MAG: nitroreductase [Nitrospirae bacterium]|nr:MAG: nitroreductase [Nitrospirota bacterium]